MNIVEEIDHTLAESLARQQSLQIVLAETIKKQPHHSETPKDKKASIVSQPPELQPMVAQAAEKLRRHVEDYIKKRLEHLEGMRDQVERVQQVRLMR